MKFREIYKMKCGDFEPRIWNGFGNPPDTETHVPMAQETNQNRDSEEVDVPKALSTLEYLSMGRSGAYLEKQKRAQRSGTRCGEMGKRKN